MELLFFLAAAIATGWVVARLIGTTGNRSTRVNKPKAAKKPNFVGGFEDQYEVEEPTSEQDEQREYQPWLTKAVEHKQNKEFDEALKCLDEAYKACADYDIVRVFDHYLRLPAYLQLAGRSDEGWAKLNEISIGVLPYRGDGPTGCECDIRLRTKISQKMVTFLNKEKRFKDSLVHATVATYLASAIYIKMMDDKWITKEDMENNAIQMQVDLQKAINKAKLDDDLDEKLNMTVKLQLDKGTEELYVLSRVPDVMNEARVLISGWS